MRDLFPDRGRPSHEVNIELARRVRNGDERARDRMIQLNAGLAYNNAIRYANMNKARTQVDADDLLQSAMVGLIEAVDNFDPERGYKFVTYAHWWVNKRISEEISRQHWNTVKPPDDMMRGYMYRRMTPEEQDQYVRTFMNFDKVELTNISTDDEARLISLEIMNAADRAGLTDIECIVFHALHSPYTKPEKESSIARDLKITQRSVKEADESALRKIRMVLGDG